MPGLDTSASLIRCLLAALTLACGAAPAAAKPPLVLASNKPVYGLTAFIMRGAGTPTLLIDSNPWLRTAPLSVDENALLKRGGLVIWIGPGLEPYLARPLQNLKESVASLPLMQAPGIRLIGSGGGVTAASATRAAKAKPAGRQPGAGRRTLVIPRDGGAVDTGRDARKPAAKPAYTPRNRQITRGDLRPRNPDPHIWLDPRNAIAMARHIAAALIGMDPENRHIYRRNMTRLIIRIETMDAENRASLQAIAPGRYTILDAKTRYFESHYLLRPAGRLIVSGRSLDDRGVATVRARLSQDGSRCVFGGTVLTAKVRKSLGARAGLVRVIDPYGTRVPADDQAYFAIMAHVTNRFVRCLDPQQPTR